MHHPRLDYYFLMGSISTLFIFTLIHSIVIYPVDSYHPITYIELIVELVIAIRIIASKSQFVDVDHLPTQTLPPSNPQRFVISSPEDDTEETRQLVML